MARAAITLEVPYHDVDEGGIAWHGHYIRYLELARTQLQREADVDVPELKRLGQRIVVADLRVRHHAPLRYGDRFTVTAWLGLIEPAVEVHYEIRRDDGARVARARTTLACVAPDEDRLASPDPVVLERLRAFAAR